MFENRTVIGTNGDDDVDLSGSNFNDIIFALKGDDRYIGGVDTQSFFYMGPGRDRATGGEHRDTYVYLPGDGDLYLFDYLDQDTNDNNRDRLFLHNGEPLPQVDIAQVSLSDIRDAYFVDYGESSPHALPASASAESNAFLVTDWGVIEIFDQYGASPRAPISDRQDGIEYISYAWPDPLGNLSETTFRISSETEPFSGTQTGDDYTEFFFGRRSDDRIYGNGGADLIFTGDGDDHAYGGSGDDHIHAPHGVNELMGEGNNDFYYWNQRFTATNVVEDGTSSSGDVLVAGFTADELITAEITGAGVQRDLLLEAAKHNNRGTVGSTFAILDQWDGSQGGVEYISFGGVMHRIGDGYADSFGSDNDFLATKAKGVDDVSMGGGADILFTNGGDDTLRGQAGDDMLFGGDGEDKLWGGGDSDLLRGGEGADRIFGGAGEDTADFRFAEEGVGVLLNKGRGTKGEAAGDVYGSIENAIGGLGDDRIVGNSQSNTVYGGHGRDKIKGGGDKDMLDGGAGRDKIAGGADRDIAHGGGGRDAIRGGDGADRIHGGGGGDKIWGNDGRDKMWGDRGGDWFYGGGGVDKIWTGAGRDKVVMSANGGRDVVFDWTDGRDKFVARAGDERFADLDIRQRGDDVHIRHDGGKVVVKDADVDDFSGRDFIF